MIHFINFPQPSNTPFQKLCKLCETVHVLNYTIMSLEKIFLIIQARNNLGSTMTDLQIAGLAFLVDIENKLVKTFSNENNYFKEFY